MFGRAVTCVVHQHGDEVETLDICKPESVDAGIRQAIQPQSLDRYHQNGRHVPERRGVHVGVSTVWIPRQAQ